MAGKQTGLENCPHVVIVNRWRERYASYEDYVDHAANRVTYITSPVGRDCVPAAAADVIVVPATDDLPAVRDAVRTLAARHGRPDFVVALKEDDLPIGAALREEWDCPGPRTEDLVLFRDKYRMYQAIEAAGLPLPAFAPMTGQQSVLDFADSAGWPVVVKPWTGSASEGVRLVSGPDDVAGVPVATRPMLIQAYCDAPIYHVDGIFTGEKLAQWRASRYLNDCLGFRGGRFLGSVEEDDPWLNEAIGAQSARFLAALTDQPVAFHLEIFVDAAAPAGPACTFLEVGARVGGAEIPFIWRELHDDDLMAAATRIQLGQPVRPAGPDAGLGGGRVGGWLLIPAPFSPPCRITEVTPMVGRHPGPYAEALLRAGEVLPLADAYYEHVGGRFRFRGGSSAEVEEAIIATARDFRVSAEPIGSAAPAAETGPLAGGLPASQPGQPGQDYAPVLAGEGDNDYARYMRIPALLSLQRDPGEVVHRDELLFQTVHQSTELWLKLACAEVSEAAAQVRAGAPEAAARLLARAALGIELITGQLEMLRYLAPADFQTIRPVLGNGSGFESPGWRAVQRVSKELRAAFDEYLAGTAAGLSDVYRGSPDHPDYRLAEAMIEWDERISVWRVRHFKIATRVIGHDVVGTKGTPVDVLVRLISHKLFPELWSVRTELTQSSPLGETTGSRPS